VSISEDGERLKKELEDYLKSNEPYKSKISEFRVHVLKIEKYPSGLKPIRYIVDIIQGILPENAIIEYNGFKIQWVEHK